VGRDDEEFEQFVAHSGATLLRSAYLLSGDHAQAEDLLQLTLLRVARRWHAARRSPDAYARRVLINASRDAWRRAGRRVEERPFADVPVEGDLSERVAVRDAVIAALRQLPLRQREVLVFRFYSDLSVAETAAAIGASEGTIKSYTSRALARMRVLLADTMEVGNAH
jgi:RNA polymerase sigma-70 factor (sigma-E family)